MGNTNEIENENSKKTHLKANQFLENVIFNHEYYNKINERDLQYDEIEFKTEKQNLQEGKTLNKLLQKNNIAFKGMNENTNQINFNLFYKALNQKLGIIILMDNNKKYCLHQIKTLFFSLYNHLAEQYVEYIIKYSYLYFLDSEEEKINFNVTLTFLDKSVKDINFPLILFIQKDSDDFEFNQSCIKYIFEDLNDKNYFIDILLSLLKDKIETETNINEMNNNENINQYYFEDEREKNKYNFITPNENLMNKEFKDADYDNIDERNDERNNMELNNNNKYKIKNSYDLLNNKINAYNNEDDNYKNEEHYFKEEEIEEAKKNLNEEPDENNLDGTEIIIRHPKTGKRSSRRFYKTDTIQSLYNYIVSNEEILQEINYQNFNMSQPFPKKIFNDFEETFEDAYLYPDGIIDIEIAK